jgi:hypothetical protein
MPQSHKSQERRNQDVAIGFRPRIKNRPD